ncbi:MAG: deoxynucleoside kinase [Syntrophomonadaceae bacterium]|nr:deoxynucleoside kinase [Syntrophomonadaceae bacterium]
MQYAKQVEIVVDGVTGVGKTSLVKIIAEEMQFKPFSELFEDENRLLQKFFHDREKWAFSMQTNFLTNRFKQYQQAMKVGAAVMDRSIYSDQIFALMYLKENYLSPEEYAVYNNLLHTLLDTVKPPRLMVYLKVDTDEAIRRIHRRGRPDEIEVERTYWDNLNQNYEKHYQNYDLGRLLVLKVDHLDYVNKPEDRRFIMGEIRRAMISDSSKTAAL